MANLASATTVRRYLSPEPLLQSPDYVSAMAGSGFSVATYAYALNNPLRYVDMDGLAPGDPFATPDEAARDALEWLRKKKNLRKNEWCGQIRKLPDGRCAADKPKRGPDVNKGDVRATCNVGPYGADSAGDLHTHPWTSAFSDPDKDVNDDGMLPGFLLGPDGNMWKYTPAIVPGIVPTVSKRAGAITPLGKVSPY